MGIMIEIKDVTVKTAAASLLKCVNTKEYTVSDPRMIVLADCFKYLQQHTLNCCTAPGVRHRVGSAKDIVLKIVNSSHNLDFSVRAIDVHVYAACKQCVLAQNGKSTTPTVSSPTSVRSIGSFTPSSGLWKRCESVLKMSPKTWVDVTGTRIATDVVSEFRNQFKQCDHGHSLAASGVRVVLREHEGGVLVEVHCVRCDQAGVKVRYGVPAPQTVTDPVLALFNGKNHVKYSLSVRDEGVRLWQEKQAADPEWCKTHRNMNVTKMPLGDAVVAEFKAFHKGKCHKGLHALGKVDGKANYYVLCRRRHYENAQGGYDTVSFNVNCVQCRELARRAQLLRRKQWAQGLTVE